jgi:hypothetical protein
MKGTKTSKYQHLLVKMLILNYLNMQKKLVPCHENPVIKKMHAAGRKILLRGANTTSRAFYRPSKRIFSYQRD